MDVDGVEMAPVAGFDEVFEPAETRRAATVGDCWGAERGLAGEGLHVFLVGGGGVVGGEVGLAFVVGFIGSRVVFVSYLGVKQSWRETYEKITLVPLLMSAVTSEMKLALFKPPLTVKVGMKPKDLSRVAPVPSRVSCQSEPKEMYLLPTKYLLQSWDL